MNTEQKTQDTELEICKAKEHVGSVVITIEKNQKKYERVNTNALNGIRGLVSIYVMLFHYLSDVINLSGTIEMPLFFLISGFGFGLCNGNKQYSMDNPFNKLNFYLKRVARTIPVYFLANLISIPTNYLVYGWDKNPPNNEWLYYVFTALGMSTWFGKVFVLTGPAWFMSTIWFFYWIFPFLLLKLQQINIRQLRKLIIVCYFIQLIVGLIFQIISIFTICVNSYFQFF